MAVRRLMAVGAATVAGTTLWAVPASAHVEVTADNARAGATNVTLTWVSGPKGGG